MQKLTVPMQQSRKRQVKHEQLSDHAFGRPDGMGAFAGINGNIILMRNHELSPNDQKEGAYFGQNPF